jgi:hypothetical protein
MPGSICRRWKTSSGIIAMGRSCKHYVDHLFGIRCYTNVSIEPADIIGRDSMYR